jgi:Cu(I)/Ag(I) efflux system membrane fusion protein
MKRAIFKNRNVRSALLIIVGLLFGWLLFHNPEKSSTPANNGIAAKDSDDHKQIWTCAMHPQIRMDHPGKCPICGMDLIPLNKSNADVDPNAVQMSESAMKLAEVQTTIVGHGNASKELRLYGKIQPDERLLVSQSAHVPGRIEQLLVNVTREKVSKGQLIARIYSPELITAQKELLEAKTLADKYPEVLEAAREKLRAWKLSDSQIAGIEKSGSVKTIFDIYATRSGVVAERKVNAGDYVSQGQVLFDMADLSQLWAIFDVYEADLSWISMGDNVEFTTQAIPGKTFNGRISFIDPVMDPSTRVLVHLQAHALGDGPQPDVVRLRAGEVLERRPVLVGLDDTQVDLEEHGRYRYGDAGEYFLHYQKYSSRSGEAGSPIAVPGQRISTALSDIWSHVGRRDAKAAAAADDPGQSSIEASR